MIGTQISQYRLIEKLGEGGMGVVYKGIDTLLDRVVAIKLISSERADNDEILQRFKSEAKVQATLSDHNIATLYSYLVWEGRAVMVMEFIEGETLQQMVARRGPIPAEVAVPLFKQALLGVGAAHRRGIVHRDIKPANIMVSREGLVKVMDFGIAKVLGVTGTTRTNLQMGTAWYMAPEQVLNRPVDARTDIYALGVTLYELLSGQVPFRADSEYEVLSSHVQRVPELPTAHYPHIPQACVAAVMRALAKEPEKRFASTEDFSAALDQTGLDPAATSTSAVPVQPVQPSIADRTKTVLVAPPSEIRVPPPIAVVPPPPPKKQGMGAGVILAAVFILIVAAGALFLFAMHEREKRSATASSGRPASAGIQQPSGGTDQERRMQAEQEQSAEELKKQLAEEQAQARPAAQQKPAVASVPTPPSPPPARQPPPVPAPKPNGDEAERLSTLTGTWSGTYTCGQGVTGATLQIVASSEQNVGALFQFAVPNSSPGSYFMRGTFDPATNRVVMKFTNWKYQPQGYSAGNISGIVNFSTNEIHGIVVLPGCAGLSMRKQ
jgi:eukaryotic-like serine/threonine-protein kinase